jgi:hypothetical protein
MTAPTWSSRDPYVTSNYKWGTERTHSPLCGSSPAGLLQMSRLHSHQGEDGRQPPMRSPPDENLPHHQRRRRHRDSAAAASHSAAQSSSHLFNNNASILPAAPPPPPAPRDATSSASPTYGVLGLGGSCGKTTFDGGSLRFIFAYLVIFNHATSRLMFT